jgi:hypothetical protein
LLQGAGFEASIPLTKYVGLLAERGDQKMSAGVASNRRTILAGPKVRIPLPPAESQSNFRIAPLACPDLVERRTRANRSSVYPVSSTREARKNRKKEADRVRKLYESLLAQRWTDRDGLVHRIGVDDILVVSPYNMQVNLLRSRLPEGARVGTVDRFQGQEAAIVLISMTTSSGHNLPRQIEFLYSRNRLNVAISRARCLTVIVVSPRLLETQCSTIDQMRLVNTLCWRSTGALTSRALERYRRRSCLGINGVGASAGR